MAHQVFGHIPIQTDDRVSPVMDACIACGEELPEKQTTNDGKAMMLFVQCAGCKRVYLLDFTSFGLR